MPAAGALAGRQAWRERAGQCAIAPCRDRGRPELARAGLRTHPM